MVCVLIAHKAHHALTSADHDIPVIEEVVGKAKEAANVGSAEAKEQARSTATKAADQTQEAANKAKKNL